MDEVVGRARMGAVSIVGIMLVGTLVAIVSVPGNTVAGATVFYCDYEDGGIQRHEWYPGGAIGWACSESWAPETMYSGWENYNCGNGSYYNAIYRSFLTFDTSAIPDAAVITSAVLQVYLQDNDQWWSPPSDTTVDVYTSDFTNDGGNDLDVADWDDCYEYQGAIWTTYSSYSMWYQLSVNVSSVSSDGRTDYALVSSLESGAGAYDQTQMWTHIQCDAAATIPPYAPPSQYRAQLLIVYEEPGAEIAIELDTGEYLNSTLYPEISEWNVTHDLYYFAVDLPASASNLTLYKKNANWTFMSVAPDVPDKFDNDTLTMFNYTYGGICYRIWYTVPKLSPLTTLYIAIYNSFTGEGFFWEQFRVMYCEGSTWDNLTAQVVPSPTITVDTGNYYTIRVLDFFGNMLADETVNANAQAIYVTIEVPVYSWQVFNMNEAPVLMRIYWNNSGDAWEFFVGPSWIVERWLKGGNYTFMVTFYETEHDDDDEILAGETVYFNQTIPLTGLNASFIYIEGTTISQIITDIEGVYALQEIITTLISPSLIIQYDSIPLAPVHLMSLSVGDELGLDPYLILETTTFDNDTGTSLEMWTPHPSVTGATYYTIADTLMFSGDYLTQVWVNTTDGDPLLNQTYLPATMVLAGENITVEANRTLSVSRGTTWREITEFVVWYYATERRYEATLNLTNDMDCAYYAPYWFVGFPLNTSIELDSVSVYDLDNDFYLTKGVHYEVTTGGVHMTLSILNASQYRNFRFSYYDENGSSDIGAPNLIVESYTSATYDGAVMKYTAVQWVNPWSVEYHGEIYITLNFTGGDALLASSIAIVDTSRSITLNPSDYIYTGRTIIIMVSGVDTVPVGGARNYAIYFTFGGVSTPERSSLIFDPIVINGSAWYIGSVPITVALLGVLCGWGYAFYAFYANRKDAVVVVFIVMALTVIVLYFQGVM